jgi:glycosyltransferase involved in cell wall biosynthesis
VHVREYLPGSHGKALGLMLKWSGCEVIFNSRATANAYPSIKKSTIIYNGVDAYKHRDRNFEKPELNVLLIGRINSWKGHGLLLEAICRLPHFLRDLLCVRIVGNAFSGQEKLEHELHDMVERRGLTSIVKFFPFSNDPESCYDWADIVVVPSIRPEPFGRVAVEAMSAGCLVVAANHGGLSEIIDDDNTGLLFTPGDPDALADALTKAIQKPDRSHIWAQNGYKEYLNHFQSITYKQAIADYLTGSHCAE